MILVEPEQSSRNYSDIPVEHGWLQCGICCKLSEINLATAKLSDVIRNNYNPNSIGNRYTNNCVVSYF